MWHNGETAPRDGSVILIAHNRGTWRYPQDSRKINCVVVYWSRGKFQQFGPDSFQPEEVACWSTFNEPPQ